MKDLRGLRVLAVDDDPFVRDLTRGLLRDLHVADIETACDGNEALAILDKFANAPHVILCDLSMPGMTGWQLARAVKVSCPSLVTGIITGWGEHAEAKPDERAWVDFMLSKPISQEALRRELAHARLRRRCA